MAELGALAVKNGPSSVGCVRPLEQSHLWCTTPLKIRNIQLRLLRLPSNSDGGGADTLDVEVERMLRVERVASLPKTSTLRRCRSEERDRPLKTKSPQGRCQHTLGVEKSADSVVPLAWDRPCILFGYSHVSISPHSEASFPQGICWL